MSLAASPLPVGRLLRQLRQRRGLPGTAINGRFVQGGVRHCI